jgi:hypothetical protein
MPPPKTGSPAKIQLNTTLRDLFRWHAIQPSPFHQAVQDAARQEGWTPPWDREEQRAKKKVAGKISGIKRGLRTEWRRTIIGEAYSRLKPRHRVNPYAEESVNALIGEYRNLVEEGCKGNLLAPRADDFISFLPELLSALSQKDQQGLQNVGREALLKDMKALGIRSKRQQQRSG